MTAFARGLNRVLWVVIISCCSFTALSILVPDCLKLNNELEYDVEVEPMKWNSTIRGPRTSPSREAEARAFMQRETRASDDSRGYSNSQMVSIMASVVAEVKRQTQKTKISILDVGCGRMDWFSTFLNNQHDVFYFGIDILGDLIESLNANHPELTFSTSDIAGTDAFSTYDLIVITRVFPELTFAEGVTVLDKVFASGSKYLFVSHQPWAKANHDLEENESNRALNLHKEPYFLPARPLCVAPAMTPDRMADHHTNSLWIAVYEISTSHAAVAAAKSLSARRTKLCDQCMWQTLRTCIEKVEEGTYVRTGDIDHMWIRDSAAQVYPYLPYVATNFTMRALIRGVLTLQAKYMLDNPYANSFKKQWVDKWMLSQWERDLLRGGFVATGNYEMDSGSYFLRLLYAFWKYSSELVQVPVCNLS
jgi:hypothetical protein